MGDGTRAPRRRVTLATVASAVGVSGATVSNAYHRPDQLSPQLRERILTAARELGYRGPDPTARALSRGRTGLIGLLFTESLAFAFTDPAAVLMLHGLGSACDDADIGLVLLPVAPGNQQPVPDSRAGVDGYVVYSMPDGDPSVDAVLASGRPVVTIDQPQVQGVTFVGVDDRNVAYLQLGHLLNLGHRQVGVLAYRLTPERRDASLPVEQQATAAYRSTRLRLAGYQNALTDARLGPDALAYQESDVNDVTGGRVAAARLLDRRPTPTALLTDADQLALGAIFTARERHLHVPSQLSVIGTDDIPAAALASPPLTTVSQPMFDKGRLAGQRLLEQIEGLDPPPATTLLPVELVLRGTTAPPPRVTG
jgi:DNA-binding LacI/PurR family transcriptional regulator